MFPPPATSLDSHARESLSPHPHTGAGDVQSQGLLEAG